MAGVTVSTAGYNAWVALSCVAICVLLCSSSCRRELSGETGALAFGTPAAGTDCPAGSEGCACTSNWTCAAGCECNAGRCFGATVLPPDTAFYRQTELEAAVAVMRSKVQDALPIVRGAVVVDLGAGRGWHTLRIARRLGKAGTVYATDLQASELGHLRQAADELRRQDPDLARIETRVCAHERDVGLHGLAPASVDVAVMTLAMQLVQDPVHEQRDIAYFGAVRKVLKAGGLLLFWQDWLHPRDRDFAQAQQLFERAGFDGAIEQIPLAGPLTQDTFEELPGATGAAGERVPLRPGFVAVARVKK